MRKLLVISIVLAVSVLGAAAQVIPASGDIPKNDPGAYFGLMGDIAVEKKILPELTLHAKGEFRMQGYFWDEHHLRLGAGAEYKLSKKVTLLGDYTMIRKHPSGDRISFRHRIEAGVQEQVKLSKKFKLSFTESLQWTHRAGRMNIYQSARNNFAVKMKAKITYSVSKKVSLFARTELRFGLSEPALADIYYDRQQLQFTDADGSPVGTPGWFLDGFSKISLNRIRSGIGINYKITRNHKVGFTVLSDYIRELDIDSDKYGTVVKSLVNERKSFLYGRIGYTFSF